MGRMRWLPERQINGRTVRRYDGRAVGAWIDRQRDGRRPQSTALELALDGWRDYGNTDGRRRARRTAAPKRTDGISA